MFSVLILNKKSTESFNEYYPLFLDAIKKNDIAVCRWYESGSDIDSALPDLHSLTDSKKKWRAIIVKTEDDIDMHEYHSENPFDYYCNETNSGDIGESEVPLIRLTHYLGGFPSPEIRFVPEIEVADGKADRVIYKPDHDKSNEELYSQLTEKYAFDGKKPTEIVLLTVRKGFRTPATDEVKTVWKQQNEINSSDFWKRNNYPSNCRFIVYDLKQDGPVQREADMFSFWTLVSLLSVNEINPNYLQAYRLYKGSIDFDEEKMQEVMQSTVVRLFGARNYVEKMIQQDFQDLLNEKKEIPNYEVNVPVVIDAPKKTTFGINYKKFPLTPSSDFEDNILWNNMKLEALETLDKCVENSERALDESADIMRDSFRFPEESITPIDKYRQKDMERNLSSVYKRIIMLFGLLPKSSVEFQEKLIEKENIVKQFFKKRICGSLSAKIISFVALLLLVSAIPAVYGYSAERFGTVKGILGTFAVSIFVIGMVELFVLLFQKFALNKRIGAYNKKLKDEVGELNNNAKVYSDFISSIATYTKGKVFLKQLSRKEFGVNNAYPQQKNHIKAINAFLSKINRWVVAFHLDVSFDVNDEVRFSIDYSEKPQINTTYSFKTNRERAIAMNKGGDVIPYSFDFVERFNLEREELYNEYRG